MNKYIALDVEGEAMAPSIGAGDRLYIDTTEVPQSNGKDVAVFNIEGDYFVCKYTRFGKQLLLLQDNGPIRVIREEQADIVGKAVEKEENPSAGNTQAIV